MSSARGSVTLHWTCKWSTLSLQKQFSQNCGTSMSCRRLQTAFRVSGNIIFISAIKITVASAWAVISQREREKERGDAASSTTAADSLSALAVATALWSPQCGHKLLQLDSVAVRRHTLPTTVPTTHLDDSLFILLMLDFEKALCTFCLSVNRFQVLKHCWTSSKSSCRGHLSLEHPYL